MSEVLGLSGWRVGSYDEEPVVPVTGSTVSLDPNRAGASCGESGKSARPELEVLSSSPSSAIYGLCDLGQVAQPL